MYGYNNGYGMQYFQPQAPTDERIWVQGESAAKAYLVANGATVTLWDAEKPRIFVKSVAANGFPTLKTLTYTEDAPTTPVDASGLEARVKQLESALDDLRKTLEKGNSDV